MDTPNGLARQFYENLFDAPEREALPGLNQFFDTQGSVCALAQKGVDGLVADYGMNRDKAQAFLTRLNPLAISVLRQYIHHQQTGPGDVDPARSRWPAGDHGPTYASLFKPAYEMLCSPQSIEAIHSPAAYLASLGYWAEYRLGSADAEGLPLKNRRTDLDKLLVDITTVHDSVPSVEVVTHVMETFIKTESGQLDIDKALSRNRYPNGLPFHRPWVTLNYLAREHLESVGSVRRLCDPESPYFLHPPLWSKESDAALSLAARFSVEQKTVLAEAPHFPSQSQAEESYFKENFGLVGVQPGNLRSQVGYFNSRTQLNQQGMEALLSIKDFATTLSPNYVRASSESVSGAHSGSVFINAGVSPAISIVYSDTAEVFNKFRDLDNPRIDRINRKLRLDKWLGLPTHQVDRLLVAAMEAENAPAPPKYWITPNTIRALGLFQELREHFACTAEDFSVFIHHLSVFGRGIEAAQFDRVFNENTLFTRPLKIDAGEFAIIPQTEADMLTISQIRSALGIELETYLYLAQVIAQAHGVTVLSRSVPILSSFYRMAKLPRLIGITPIEAVALLQIMGGDNSLLFSLAGAPRIIAGQKEPEHTDVLSVIQALVDSVRWCQDAGLTVHWVAQHVPTAIASALPSQVEFALAEQLMIQIVPGLFTEQLLSMGGAPLLPNNRPWLEVLKALVDEKGLVLHFEETAERPYKTHAREAIDRAVKATLPDLDEGEQAVLTEKILDVLLRCRSGQHSVVQEGLSGYSGLASDITLLVLTWSGASVYQVLARVLSTSTLDAIAVSRRQEPDHPEDAFWVILAEFLRRSSIVRTLELSTMFLQYHLEENREQTPDGHTAPVFSLATLYHLSVYKRALALSAKPEEQLVSYFQRVGALPTNLTADGKTLAQHAAAKLLAELFTWSTREVLACALRISPDEGLIRTVAQLDLLLRVRAFALRSGMDAEAILAIGTLPPDGTYEQYEAVADRVTASLTQPGNPLIADDVGSVGQDVQMTVTVEPERLIANKPDEFATYTITVQNRAGRALRGVNVHWLSTLGRLEALTTPTEDDGVATVKLHAGTVMGSAMTFYQHDLGKQLAGPTVEIGFDVSTLSPTGKSPVPTKPMVGKPVSLFLTLEDDYGNLAADQSVLWTFNSPIILPIETGTNRAGLAEVTFTSEEPGSITVTATILANGNKAIFRPIEFTPAADGLADSPLSVA